MRPSWRAPGLAPPSSLIPCSRSQCLCQQSTDFAEQSLALCCHNVSLSIQRSFLSCSAAFGRSNHPGISRPSSLVALHGAFMAALAEASGSAPLASLIGAGALGLFLLPGGRP